MADLTIQSGEALTVESGDAAFGSPVNVGGQLNLGGELNTYPAVDAAVAGGATTSATLDSISEFLSATARAGAVVGRGIGTIPLGEGELGGGALPALQGEKDVLASVASGASATATPSGAKYLLANAGAGVAATSPLVGEKDILASAESGAAALATLDSLVPLWRTNSGTIDADRTDEFDVGVGEMDDE